MHTYTFSLRAYTRGTFCSVTRTGPPTVAAVYASVRGLRRFRAVCAFCTLRVVPYDLLTLYGTVRCT